MKWVGGFFAGAGAVALGVLISKSAPKFRKHRHFKPYRFRRRRNPGWEHRQLEIEMLAFIREARETLQVMNNPKRPTVDAEFIEPVPANASDGSQAASPEAEKK